MLRKLVLFSSLSLLYWFNPIVGHAEDLYTVEPVLPSNQEKGVNNYISIMSNSPTVNQEIEFVISNKTENPLTLKVEPLNALTSPNGVIQYINVTEVENASLIDPVYSLPQYVTIGDKLTLEPKEKKKVKGVLSISNVGGTILGGVGFSVFEEPAKTEDKAGGFKISNEMNTVIGVMARMPKGQPIVFDIGEAYLSPMPLYYAVRLPITLNSSSLLKDVSIKYLVTNAKKEELFKSEEKRIFNFAPKTKANVLFPWEAETIDKSATYTLEGELTYIDNNGKEIVTPFTKDFKFEESKEGVSDSMFAPKSTGGFNYWYLGLLLLVPLAFLLLYLRRKNVYVLYSNSMESNKVITESHELFKVVAPLRLARNDENLNYVHMYSKAHNTEKGKEKEYRYLFIKTKKSKVQKKKDLSSLAGTNSTAQ